MTIEGRKLVVFSVTFTVLGLAARWLWGFEVAMVLGLGFAMALGICTAMALKRGR